MPTDEINFHHLLKRQLKRLHLNPTVLPNVLADWENFLIHINNAYENADQERYLLERSMDISSKEMIELNTKLEDAQRIAHLGYWHYDQTENHTHWSKEAYRVLEIEADGSPLGLEKILEMIYEEDRKKLLKALDNALKHSLAFEIELKVKTTSSNLRWVYVKGEPTIPTTLSPMSSIGLAGIIIDITERKNAEEKMKKLHQQLIDSARQAGMAEIAISVLHNIGNVLNSANVSIKILQESSYSAYISKLIQIAKLLNENLANPTYLSEDSKGKLIPNYLATLGEKMAEENIKSSNEINNLDIYIKHINDIVHLQNDISGMRNLIEKIYLPEIIDISLQMALATNQNINVVKNTTTPIFIEIDRAKLIQILVNLLRNAKDSVLLSNNKNKSISLTTEVDKVKNTVKISVTDNGIGIDADNISKIFAFGYTTKKDGHGFGLHSSALAAREMGGKLSVTSNGVQQGATFILQLPFVTQATVKGEPNNATV